MKNHRRKIRDGLIVALTEGETLVAKSFLEYLASQRQEEEDFSPEDLSEIEEGFAQIRWGEYATIRLGKGTQPMQIRVGHQVKQSLARLDRDLVKRIRETSLTFFLYRLNLKYSMKKLCTDKPMGSIRIANDYFFVDL